MKQPCRITLPSGETVVANPTVQKVIQINVDCGCWQHASLNQRFLIIVTEKGAAFIRTLGRDHHFSNSDTSGPIMVALEKPEPLETENQGEQQESKDMGSGEGKGTW